MEFFHSIPKIRFMAARKICYAISILVVVGSIAVEAYRGLNFAIDFTGGVVIEAGFTAAADLDRTHAALDAAGFKDVAVQVFGTSKDVLVRLPPLIGATPANEITKRIETALRTVDPGVQIRRTEVVGPQVGKELAYK